MNAKRLGLLLLTVWPLARFVTVITIGLTAAVMSALVLAVSDTE